MRAMQATNLVGSAGSFFVFDTVNSLVVAPIAKHETDAVFSSGGAFVGWASFVMWFVLLHRRVHTVARHEAH